MQDIGKFSVILKKNGILVLEYIIKEDRLVVYDEQLSPIRELEHCLSLLEQDPYIHPEDRWKAVEFYKGNLRGPVEIRTLEKEGEVRRKILDASLLKGEGDEPDRLIVSMKDITKEKRREELLEEQAQRDSLTMLYNQQTGKERINEYLDGKDPYASCGLMVIDIDYFKDVNDNYGHLFGNTALIELSHLLLMMFDQKDIIMRAGGDEFAVLLKDITHSSLVKKAMELVKAVRMLQFKENDYRMTCSVGVCFLPENVSGYTYDQLFSNADWALYQAKENGRNQYAFCDNLKRFELSEKKEGKAVTGIEERYLYSDIVFTALEIFERMNSFDAAMELLLKVIGIRFRLDRITVIQTDIRSRFSRRLYQWLSSPEVGEGALPERFSKDDFLTLFHRFDEFGSTVLDIDDMGMYQPEAREAMERGNSKSIIYASMYCEGRYIGAVAYSTCVERRRWLRQERSQLGKLAKIISNHLSVHLDGENGSQPAKLSPEYDSLTGLLSFTRFRSEVDRIISEGLGDSHVMVYSDFENFKYFNQKYGYSKGDRLLKEFSSFIIGTLKNEAETYFTRVVADQFILFMPYLPSGDTEQRVHAVNAEFVRRNQKNYPEVKLQIRTGIYYIDADCSSASAAIDAANYARKQVDNRIGISARLYDETLSRQQKLENELISGFDAAIRQNQFRVYLQPRFSLKDFSIIGAEAMVRWQWPDGTVLYPKDFLALYEKNGRVIDLDFYIFEQVVKFMAKNNELGRKQVPISVNASILHAQDDNTVSSYLEILRRYHVDPSFLEIELTETDTLSYYDNVKKLFGRLQKVHMMTSLDDFGAGYSILNTVIDMPVNTVKLDRAFLNICEASRRGIFFLEQIVAMVKGLGCHVVCEGVETREQVEILRNIGCEEAQGYWFSHPVPVEEYERLAYPEEVQQAEPVIY